MSQPQCHSVAGRIRYIKIPMTSSGFKPATFWLVAYRLNRLLYPVSHFIKSTDLKQQHHHQQRMAVKKNERKNKIGLRDCLKYLRLLQDPGDLTSGDYQGL
jgi:hypothetical protein